jgi:TetR/AcrR family transcriptional regulator, fatty acid metabolism regulator protein
LTKVGRTTNFLIMRPEAIPLGQGGQDDRSFIERARRAQIIECAINTIAELGYNNASLAEIAKRAGVSKGVISYHFAGKRELIEQIVATVLETASAEMLPRIFAEHNAARMLRAYIESNLDFLAAHHNQIVALMHIAVGATSEDGKPLVNLTLAFNPAVAELEGLFRSGQERGEFRDFPTRVMATTLRSAIDGLASLLTADPDLDLRAYAQELATMFDLATRK